MTSPPFVPQNPKEARVSSWDSSKGFGFLGEGRDRIFLHRRDFVRWQGQPAVGDRIRFVPGTDAAGRRCATQAQGVEVMPRIKLGPLLLLALLLVLPLTAAWVYGLTTLPWLAFLALINLAAWLCYAADKRRAQANRWRIPESTLHLMELAGGWPAALLAQRWLRHKCTKKSYQTTFWLIVGLYQATAYDSLHRWKYTSQLWNHLKTWLASSGTGL